MPMTIDKAIETLQDIINAHASARTPDSLASIQLGIEALKLIAQEPPVGYTFISRPLPGETEA